MINTHRRSSLLVILATAVLLLAGTGLFLISRPTARATTPPPSPFSEWPATFSAAPSGSSPQWSDWDDLGGSFNAGPSVTSWSLNRLDVFVRAAGQTMLHRAYNGRNGMRPRTLEPPWLGGPERSHAARIGSTSSFAVPTTSFGGRPGTEGGWATSPEAGVSHS